MYEVDNEGWECIGLERGLGLLFYKKGDMYRRVRPSDKTIVEEGPI